MQDEEQVQVDHLIDKFNYAMLVTQSLEGEIRARPMVIVGHDEGGVIYFATRAEDGKLGEIIKNPSVGVTLQGGRRFVSISGRARVETSRDVINSIWPTAMKVWFPDGIEDPQLVVILIEPTYAEYWDQAGLNRPVVLWEEGKALLTGTIPSSEPAGAHAKITD